MYWFSPLLLLLLLLLMMMMMMMMMMMLFFWGGGGILFLCGERGETQCQKRKYLPKRSSSLIIISLLTHGPDGIVESTARWSQTSFCCWSAVITGLPELQCVCVNDPSLSGKPSACIFHDPSLSLPRTRILDRLLGRAVRCPPRERQTWVQVQAELVACLLA